MLASTESEFVELAHSIRQLMYVQLIFIELGYSAIKKFTVLHGDKSPINILVLSIAYLGISIPIFWAVLDLDRCANLEMLRIAVPWKPLSGLINSCFCKAK